MEILDGLPIGDAVNASVAPLPERVSMDGRYVRLEPVDPATHGPALWEGVHGNDHLWAYLFSGPYADRAGLDAYLTKIASADDPLFFAIVDKRSNRAVGMASLMRIDPANRVIEVGGILYTPALQQTRGATEAMYLMAKYAFDLGYRRYEWKCNDLNAPSRIAALRLGFTFEGIFRQHMIAKGRNRDTAWYSMLDSEWPACRSAFERWLAPGNFDESGKQKSALAALRANP